MMLNRIPIKQFANYRLLKAKRPAQLVQPKRFRFDDPHDEYVSIQQIIQIDLDACALLA